MAEGVFDAFLCRVDRFLHRDLIKLLFHTFNGLIGLSLERDDKTNTITKMKISELKECSLFQLIDFVNQKGIAKNKKDFKKEVLNDSDLLNNYEHIDLKEWNSEKKETLLKGVMIEIVKYYLNSIEMDYDEHIGHYESFSSFDLFGFSSVLDVVKGKNEIYISKVFMEDVNDELKIQN